MTEPVGTVSLVRDDSGVGAAGAAECSLAGHSKSEWARLPLECGGVASLIIGSAFFNGCSAIPMLTTQIVTYGTVSTAIPLLRFHFGLFKPPPPGATCLQKLKGVVPDDPLAARAKQILDPLQLLYFPLAIWGAVLTFGRLSLFGGSKECHVIVYLSGFITSLILIVVFGLVIFVGAAVALARAIHGDRATSERDVKPGFDPHEP